ncbi:MAG TPA: hypothetical protein VNX01_14210 [Bacteroidia bacterium]|jgi:hypothetical protein|nr:hypothetical protein [Bacteroidia bacterium]
MKISSQKLEGTGLILLLISFGWQVFQQDISDLAKEQQDCQIHEKLDHLWFILGDLYTHSSANNSSSITQSDFDVISRNWKYWADLQKERERVESQGKFF